MPGLGSNHQPSAMQAASPAAIQTGFGKRTIDFGGFAGVFNQSTPPARIACSRSSPWKSA
jgi:hypothetical protein